MSSDGPSPAEGLSPLPPWSVDDTAETRVGPWHTAPAETTPRFERRRRRMVPLLALVGALVVLVAVAATGGVLLVGAHHQEESLRRTRQVLRTDLAGSRATVASDAAQIGQQRSTIAGLNSQMLDLTSHLNDANQRVKASAQLSAEIASVADSLHTCVSDSEVALQGINAENAGGYFDPIVTVEAQTADSACNQAMSDYQALLAQLQIAGAGSSVSA